MFDGPECLGSIGLRGWSPVDPGFTLRLLGTPALVGPDGPVGGRLVQRHRVALLALLAAAPHQVLSRDRVIGLLWPELDAARARHLLSVALHELRGGLGPAAILSTGDDLRLDAGRVQVDLLSFRRAIECGDLDAAVALAGGPFLDGLYLSEAEEFEHWVDRIRGEIRASFLEALESLASRAVESGDRRAAARRYRQLVGEDPLNSRYVAGLMQAWEVAGDHANALAAAADHIALLRRELGTDPDAGFQALVERLRQQPVPVNRGPPVPAPESPRQLPDLAPASEGVAAFPPAPGRRRRAIPVALGAIALAGLAALAWTLSFEPPVPTIVAVAPFANRSGDPGLDHLGPIASERIRQAIGRLDLVQAAPPIQVSVEASVTGARSGEGDHSTWRRAARRAGAGTLITGSFWLEGDSLVVAAALGEVGANAGEADAGRAAAVPGDPAPAIDEIESRILGALAVRFDERLAALQSPGHPPPRYAAYREFAVGVDALLRGEYSNAADHMIEAGRLDPGFHAARVLAAELLQSAARFPAADSANASLAAIEEELGARERPALEAAQARLAGDRFGALRASREAARLAPRSHRVVEFAAAATSLGRAREALDAVAPLARDSSWLWRWVQFHRHHGSALHALGRYEEELAAVRRGRGLETDLVIHAIAEARALAGLGLTAEVDRLVDETLALADQPNLSAGSLMLRTAHETEVHGHPDAARRLLERAERFYRGVLEREVDPPPVVRWSLAGVLQRLGRLEEAKLLLQALFTEEPTMYVAHAGLGTVAARQGDREEALRWAARLTVPEPGSNVYDAAMRTWHRATIHALLGEPERAMELLRVSVAQGLPGNMALDSLHLPEPLWALRSHPGLATLQRPGW